MALFRRLWDGLGDIHGVTRFGPTPDQPRTPTVGFVVRGVDSESVTRSLAERAVFVSHGDFYASTIVRLLGHADDGLVRAGLSCYTSADEVERLLEGLRAIAA